MLGVCLKYYHENYGGMLQAYATISIIEERKLEYELIRYKKLSTPQSVVKSLPRLLNGVLLNDKYEILKKRLGQWKHPEFSNMDAIRMVEFNTFQKAHFTKLSPIFCGYNELCRGTQRYSAILTGSDQLWSPAGLPTNFYNLMFVPESIRKISFASSFGVNDIPWYQRTRTAAFLNRLDHISMRENRGAEIVEELTGRKVPVILDPVFLFDKAGWEKLIPVKQEIEEPYIFAYFLGDNPEHRQVVTQAARKLGCKIVTLRHMDQYVASDEDFGDYAPYDVGPDRFLNLLRGATYVCTDSYHGACFSVIHRKRFVVFDRYHSGFRFSKNSRIDTLCQNLKLQNIRYKDKEFLVTQLSTPVQYSETEDILLELRQKALRYIDLVFEGLR